MFYSDLAQRAYNSEMSFRAWPFLPGSAPGDSRTRNSAARTTSRHHRNVNTLGQLTKHHTYRIKIFNRHPISLAPSAIANVGFCWALSRIGLVGGFFLRILVQRPRLVSGMGMELFHTKGAGVLDFSVAHGDLSSLDGLRSPIVCPSIQASRILSRSSSKTCLRSVRAWCFPSRRPR